MHSHVVMKNTTRRKQYKLHRWLLCFITIFVMNYIKGLFLLPLLLQSIQYTMLMFAKWKPICRIVSVILNNVNIYLQSSTAVTHCLLIATHFTDPYERMIACIKLESATGSWTRAVGVGVQCALVSLSLSTCFDRRWWTDHVWCFTCRAPGIKHSVPTDYRTCRRVYIRHASSCIQQGGWPGNRHHFQHWNYQWVLSSPYMVYDLG